MTKWQLMNAFLNGQWCRFPEKQVQLKVINKIEREDGSNSSFNVTGIGMTGIEITLHIRTTD